MKEALKTILEEYLQEQEDLEEYIKAIYKTPAREKWNEWYEKGYFEGQLRELRRITGTIKEVLKVKWLI